MLIATLPPQAAHGREIAQHPAVDQVRLNTGVDTGQRPATILDGVLSRCGDTPLLLDLKARQLRITKWVDPSLEYVRLNHRIAVDTPCTVVFRDEVATIVDVVDGDKIVLDEAPQYALGAGQSLNIPHPSLVIEGFLTERDKEFIEAAKTRGLHRYLLSFVESGADIDALLELDPEAEIICKIESPKGLEFVRTTYPRYAGRVRLMSARDDLYSNIGKDKLAMLDAERLIIRSDPSAIAASRILTSLERSKDGAVSLGDLKDLEWLYDAGYRNFMLSDTLCLNRKAFLGAVTTFTEFLRYRASCSVAKLPAAPATPPENVPSPLPRSKPPPGFWQRMKSRLGGDAPHRDQGLRPPGS